MSDNVILLGAGASFDAGIPLLGNFMEKMIEMAITGRSPKGLLTETQIKIFSKVLEIRNRLENYHARVALNQFNIEQVLSILSFESLCGDKAGKRDLQAFTRAISTAIELNCAVLHNGKLNEIQETGRAVYRDFWTSILKHWKKCPKSFPTIITFNYDLVLERSLFQMAVGHPPRLYPVGVSGFRLNFCNESIPNRTYTVKHATWGDYRQESKDGSILVESEGDMLPDGFLDIKLLKLHGSLNFPSGKVELPWSPLNALEEPKIIPPVFNKTDSTFGTPIWKSALDALRSCKHLIICGYSLPTTDTYMQYFLKAALGPNRNLHRLHVFDPEIFKGAQKGKDLEERYGICFSEQFRDRIQFRPPEPRTRTEVGTFHHMVTLLQNSPRDLLFGIDA